jgi:hypothetical protein
VSGLVLGLVLGTAILVSHAQDPDPDISPSPQAIAHAAEVAGVDEIALAGAVVTTHLEPMVYLHAVHELENPPLLNTLPPPAPTSPPAPASGAFSVWDWDALARCESSGNWHANTGNGFFGGLQFTLATWHAYGGVGSPAQASREQQIAVAQRVLAGQGFNAWPTCARRLGLIR